MVESEDNIQDCVKRKMQTIAQEKGDSFNKKEQKQALGKSFGMCREKSDSVGICSDCKKEKDLYYQKLCNECYQKRVKNYVKKYDMNESKMRKAINQLEAEMKEKGITDSEERETYYRMRFMGIMSTGTVRTKEQDLIEKILRIQQDSIKSFVRRGRQRTLAGLDPKFGQRCVVKYKGKWRKCLFQRRVRKEWEVVLSDPPYEHIWVPKEAVRPHSWFRDFTREDASIFAQGVAKVKESKARGIFFRQYRPLETLQQVTEVQGKEESSNIAGMEYSEGMLKVTFNWAKKGEVEYGYDVGPDFYDRMAKSYSKGKFLWSELRGKTPGYVIDNPRKMTPGGVGGSIVPYTKITKRGIQGDEFKKLQKQYAKQLKGKVKVVAHMPFVRAKQKIISRKSKGFGASPSLDLSEREFEQKYRGYHAEMQTRGGSYIPVTLTGKWKPNYIEVEGHGWVHRSLIDLGGKTKYPISKKRYKLKQGEKGFWQDFVIIKELSDAIPVKGHYITRNGKKIWVKEHQRTGTKAEELKKKIKGKKLERTPIPRGEAALETSKIEQTFAKWKAERKGEKPEEKATTKRRGLSEEEKRRKEIDKQAAKTKATAPPEPREEAIQKLIEETGMERKQAEERIAKVMGLSPEQAEKKAEVKAHAIKFKAENVALSTKLIALNQINAKLNSTPLKNFIKFCVKAFILMAQQQDPEVYLKELFGYHQKLKRDKALEIKQKTELLAQIKKIHQELEALSKKKKAAGDFSVKAHFRKGKPVKAFEKKGEKKVKPLKQRSKKSYDKFEHKDIKKKIKGLDSTLKSLRKKMDSGDEDAKKKYYILLKYRNQLGDKKFKLQGEILFPKKEDFEYISAAVDQCAKRRIAKAGGKGNYNSEVAECIRLIGISRRQAGMSPRPQGTAREQRRGARRERTQDRTRVERRQASRTERRQTHEAEQTRLHEAHLRQIANQSRTELTRRHLRAVETNLHSLNVAAAEESLGYASNQIRGIQDDTPLVDELLEEHRRAAEMIGTYREQIEVERISRERGERERLVEQVNQNFSQVSNFEAGFETFIHDNDPDGALTILRMAKRKMALIERLLSSQLAQTLPSEQKDQLYQQYVDWQNKIDGWDVDLTELNARMREYQHIREERENTQEAENERRAFEEEQASFLEATESSEVIHIEIPSGQAEAIRRRREATRALRGSGTPQERIRQGQRSSLNEPEGGSMHTETPQSQQQYEYTPGNFRTLSEGEYIYRQGYFYEHATAGRSWRRPVIRSGESASTRIASRMGRVTSQTPGQTSAERSAGALARHQARREGWKREIKQLMEREGISRQAARARVIPPKVKWKTTAHGRYSDGSAVDIKNFKKNKWRSGSSLYIEIYHPDGRRAGYADIKFSMVSDQSGRTHRGMYLSYLKFKPEFSGETQGQRPRFRNKPSKDLGATLVKIADKNKLWIAGNASPIGVARGSAASQRLFNFYYSFGATPYHSIRMGQESAGFFREPVGQWADLVMMIRIKNPMNLFQYTDGHIYYYDEETDMIYRMEFNASDKIKNKIKKGE